MLTHDLKRALHDRLGLAGLCCGVVLIGLLAWLLFGTPLRKDNKTPTTLYCPQCLEDMPYQASLKDRPCPRCCPGGPKMIAVIGDPLTGEVVGKGSGAGRWWAFGVLSAIVAQATIFFGLWRGRVLREQEEAFLNRPLACRCPSCNRKVGYPARKAGLSAGCPRCKFVFTLPAEDPEAALLDHEAG